MNQVNQNKTGLTFAVVAGGLHVIWIVLILIGLAQPLIDLVFKLHMIKGVFSVNDFSLGVSVSLVIVTSMVGYAIGYVFAAVWNRVHA